MAYFRSLLTVRWPNMIPDALGGARGYSCSPRLLCAWQLPPPFLLLHPLRMRKPHRSQRKRAGVVGSLQGITVIIFQVEKKNNKCIYLFLFVWQSGCNFFSSFLFFFLFPSFLSSTDAHLSLMRPIVQFVTFIFRHLVTVGVGGRVGAEACILWHSSWWIPFTLSYTNCICPLSLTHSVYESMWAQGQRGHGQVTWSHLSGKGRRSRSSRKPKALLTCGEKNTV